MTSVTQLATGARGRRVFPPGSPCPDGCDDIVCLKHGGIILIPRVPRGEIAECYRCRRAWCNRCGSEVLRLDDEDGLPKYICATCNSGIDVFLGFFPDGERVHLTDFEVASIKPLTLQNVITHAMCRSQ